MNFFGYGAVEEVEIILDGYDRRKKVNHAVNENKTAELCVYYDGENVSGAVSVTLKSGTKLEHKGIRIELIGQIDIFYDRANQHDFTSLTKQLASPGVLNQSKVFSFDFPHVEKPYESYFGNNVRLRYFLRVTVGRRLTDLTRELEFVVHTLSTYPDTNSSLKMEVGIEDCLHIEFEYNKQKYHLKDAIVGKIYFLLVRVKIKHMEVHIIKRETTGSGVNTYHEDDTIAKFEIMDGAPVKGESIPIRLFLAGYELTPSMREVNKKFSVRYFLNLVLIDEEDRRYFKQQEIILWRKGDVPRRQVSKVLEDSTQRFEK